MKELETKDFLEKYARIDECPVRNVIAHFSGKWSMLILCILAENDAIRFNQLSRAIPDISPKMLTANLRTLEEEKLVTRHIFPEIPPRVEYSLTPKGKTLIPILHNLITWALDNWHK